MSIAMEYFPLGDLQSYLFAAPALPESEAQQITFQILEGVSFMHTNGFAHRDLKPAVCTPFKDDLQVETKLTCTE